MTAPLIATAGLSHTRETVAAYVALTKPRIIELLLLTTLPVMFLASDGVPSLALVVFTLVGGTLSAGSANALNCVVDADIDARMRRTRRRPLARQAVSRQSALVFGLVLGLVSTVILAAQVNWQSALLALIANVFYVVGYTMWLKPRTTQNIVWGGAAGCFPTLIGWTAVHGLPRLAAGRAVPGGLLLDPSALLGVGDALPRGLRGGRRADVAGGGHSPCRRSPDPRLRRRDGGDVAGAVAGGPHRSSSTRSSPRDSGPSSSARRCCCSAGHAPPTTWLSSSRCGCSTSPTCT